MFSDPKLSNFWSSNSNTSLYSGTFHGEKSARINKYLTDARYNPDVLTIYIKSKSDQENTCAVTNYTNNQNNAGKLYPIIGNIYGARRVYEAAKKIFQGLSDGSGEIKIWHLREEFKNLGRGLVELIPLSGPILVLYDEIRKAIITRNLNKVYKNMDNVVVIAFNDRIITHVDLNELDKIALEGVDPAKLSKKVINQLRMSSMSAMLNQYQKQRYDLSLGDICYACFNFYLFNPLIRKKEETNKN